MAQIENTPVTGDRLTKEEEEVLFLLVRQGQEAKEQLKKNYLTDDEKSILEGQVEKAADAKKKLFTANMYLIDNVKYQYNEICRYWLEDVQQDAAIKLMECIERYDPDRGAAFSTYAERCIKGCIVDALAVNSSPMITKKNRTLNLWKLKRFQSDFYMENGREAKIEDIMEYMQMEKGTVCRLLSQDYSVVSYDTPPDYEGREYLTPMEYENCCIAEETLDKMTDHNLMNLTDSMVPGSYLYEQVGKQLENILISCCNGTERIILYYRFGFFGQPFSDQQIADKLGMDVSQVEQIWGAALLKLEDPCKNLGLNKILS